MSLFKDLTDVEEKRYQLMKERVLPTGSYVSFYCPEGLECNAMTRLHACFNACMRRDKTPIAQGLALYVADKCVAGNIKFVLLDASRTHSAEFAMFRRAESASSSSLSPLHLAVNCCRQVELIVNSGDTRLFGRGQTSMHPECSAYIPDMIQLLSHWKDVSSNKQDYALFFESDRITLSCDNRQHEVTTTKWTMTENLADYNAPMFMPGEIPYTNSLCVNAGQIRTIFKKNLKKNMNQAVSTIDFLPPTAKINVVRGSAASAVSKTSPAKRKKMSQVDTNVYGSISSYMITRGSNSKPALTSLPGKEMYMSFNFQNNNGSIDTYYVSAVDNTQQSDGAIRGDTAAIGDSRVILYGRPSYIWAHNLIDALDMLEYTKVEIRVTVIGGIILILSDETHGEFFSLYSTCMTVYIKDYPHLFRGKKV